MGLSQLASSIAESPTLKLNEEARILRAKGEAVIHLGIGEPKNKTPEAAIASAAALLNQGDVKYSSTDGTPGLKQAILRYTEANYGRTVSPANVIVSSGAKQSIFNLLYALLAPQDEVVLLAPYWVSYPEITRMCRGVPVIVTAADGGFRPSLAEFERALTPRTKIVAVTQMSNVLGAAPPIKDIVRVAHAHGVPVLVDGSQGAVHLDVDVRDLDVDFYAFTGHKVYGPTGIGVLYGKRAQLESLPPFNGGGEMIDTVTRDAVTYNPPPHRFEAGTPPIVQAIGLAAALDYVDAIGRVRIRAHEQSLSAYAHERLGAINSLRIIGAAPGKGPIVSFTMNSAHAHDVATVIDRAGVAVRAGTHCAMPLLKRFGVTSTCRASLALYSGKDDIDALVEGIEKAQKLLA